nr:rrna-processing protein utp23 [Quercus suber]
MRAKRAKQYRKLMQQYQLTFSFREPYQILVDASIIQAAARYKMRLGSLLSTTLHGEIKPMITQCCIRHLYALSTTTPAEKAEKDGWIEVAKQAERRLCGHHELEEPLSAEECIMSVLDPKGAGANKHRYVVATQEYELRARLRKVAGVPLVYINRSVMILEPMGQRTGEVREAEEKSKVRAGLKGRRSAEVMTGAKRKREEDDMEEDGVEPRINSTAQTQKKQKKMQGPKGPNPLAVKKPKKELHKSTKTTSKNDDRAERPVGPLNTGFKDPLPRQRSDATEQSSGNGVRDPDAARVEDRKRRRKRKPSNKTGRGEGDGEGGVEQNGTAYVAIDVS